ncbi:MAG: hypothetical protein NC310_03960 [Roseburia sp.]|nr:hypothetical protein [Anaeroplasma bactoclasticum]MCM1196215.1 hypothetical protein [Roseburia sp.]MCM1556018.1 hypothetical protein [Anaeroplasma bactoclasticum]
MEKGFKIQRIGFVIYLLTMIVLALYTLSFMTDYQNLFGYLLKQNESITRFYEHMQAFNQIIFWLAIVSVLSIIVMFVLELRTRICDRFALGVMSCFGALNIGTAIYGFISIPKLVTEYKGVDFSKMWLEDTALTEDSVYTMRFTSFNLGYAVFAILLIVTIFFMATLWINHIKFKRNEGLGYEKV